MTGITEPDDEGTTVAVEGTRGVRRHLGLLVSGGLVLVIGGLGLVAGQSAGDQATQVHRADRLALQERLSYLVEQYSQVNAAEVVDELASQGPWSPRAGDPATTARLQALVEDTRVLDAGALLVSSLGAPLAAWSSTGLPDADDPGWAPLRAAARAGDGRLPLSDVLATADAPLLAMALPVLLEDGSRALVVGLWDARLAGLQRFVGELRYGDTGRGYVVDSAGAVIAGPEPRRIGQALPMEQLRRQAVEGPGGILDTADEQPLVTSYAPVGRTGWVALTPQDREEFEGALVRSSRLVQALVVALLLIAGGSLVVLHRKREAALESVALRDELTGLYNRRGWFALADHELERARRQGTPRVLLFVDLDGLKQVNDQLGHREGDRAIAAAAGVLTAASRASDLVGRLGGDEFVLLLGDDGHVDAARSRVLRALAEHNACSGDGFELRLSLGAEVWFPDAATTLSELVRRADEHMYAEKTARPERATGVVRLPSPRAAADEVAHR